MHPVRITAVSYTNTLPFIHGLKNSGLFRNFSLSLDVPSECARKISSGEAEVGLVPVGALPGIPGYRVIGDLCIGADKEVKSVLLLSDSNLPDIRTIYLDTDSRTSVNLVKILAEKAWKINPEWRSLALLEGNPKADEGVVLIGDKTFGLASEYRYCFDLAAEWIRLTDLPFVFAVWITRNPVVQPWENDLNAALSWGVAHRVEAAEKAEHPKISSGELISYLQNDISYALDSRKQKGMELFLGYLQESIPA
jgi:chorismate dehydratase